MMPQEKKNTALRILAFLLLLVLIPFQEVASAQWLMSYHGYLDQGPGIPLTGKVPITFSLYNVHQGGEPLWSEVHEEVEVNNGFYQVTLGSITPIDLPENEQYFIGVRVGKYGALPGEKGEISEVTSALLETLGTGSSQEKRDALLVMVPPTSETMVLELPSESNREGLGAVVGPPSEQSIGAGSKEVEVAAEIEQPKSESIGSPAYPYLDDLEARLTQIMSGVEGVNIRHQINSVKMTLPSDILFAPYSTELKSNGKENINKIVTLLTEFPQTRIELAVHTDSIGTYEYNDQLAAKRVSVLKKAINDLGVGSKRMTAVVFGERQPLVDNGFDWGRRINRRVEIVILPQE